MSKPGRPQIEINQTDFEKLCGLHCTLADIAGFFDCSEDTIERWCERNYEQKFRDVWAIKSSKGKISLRRFQFAAAEKGNVTMLIWLGKQFLGQSEKIATVNQEHLHFANVQEVTQILMDNKDLIAKARSK